MSYIALIGDIIDSRHLADRSAVQKQLKKACAEINREAGSYGIVSPLTVTLGDEFQALFDEAGSLWRCIVRLEALMDPVAFRFSLGVGELTTEVHTESALEMDGPAFHRAREGISRLKKSGMRYNLLGLDETEALVQASLDLFSHSREKWKGNRVAVLAGLLAGTSIDEITTSVKISKQAIYDNIRQGALRTLVELLEQVSLAIDSALGQKGE